MHVRILGSAAGGGFPQWNCACPNCRLLRAGKFAGKPRSQAQIAVSPDGRAWFLLGASPDLRSQIESFPALHPTTGVRSSPLNGVVLAGADLDHVLGLLLLRELQPLNVYATGSVLHILRDHNAMFNMLNRVPDQVEWQTIRPGGDFSLRTPAGSDAGITCSPFFLSDHFPAYATGLPGLLPEEAVIGIILTSASGKRLAYLPSVADISPALIERLQQVDLLLFDGTFFTDDELVRVQGSGLRARDMGHVPVGGAGGSLLQLASLTRAHKLYIHINNTNPMLDESSPEYRAVRDAGWELAEDGWQLKL